MNGGWHNVSRREPCPICHKPDWCTLSNDGAVCVCRRVESLHPTASGSGWIHGLAAERTAIIPPRPAVAPRSPAANPFPGLHGSFDGDRDFISETLWSELGLMDDTLAEKMDVRYDHVQEVLSFPMRNVAGEITGLRYRHLMDGKKWSARGSKDGLFMVRPLTTDDEQPTDDREIYICEGPSDTCAALSLGLNAIGRSSCMSGVPLVREYLRRHHVRRATIIADGDKPGRDGARRLAGSVGISSRIILPPPGIKDLRDWVGSGLNREEWLRLEKFYFPRF